MRILVVFRADFHEGHPVPAYPWSYVEAFREMGHEVEVCGEGHAPILPDPFYDWPDFVLEIENGRNEKGDLDFYFCSQSPKPQVRSAVLLYDTHGHPELHSGIAPHYDHVFFGSWCKRDLFAGHRSAHWCPSATDLKWFGADQFRHIEPEFDVGFFGSKKGLSRADDLVELCKRDGWSYDVRQVNSHRKPRWPATGEAMARCSVLFNRGQKRDSPNLRCIESMAMGRPLLSNHDPESGMDLLFDSGSHYYAYDDPGDMEAALRALLHSESLRNDVAEKGRREVEDKHLVKHRAQQILEVATA